MTMPSIEIRSAFPGDLGKKEDEEEEKILLIAQTEVSLSQQSYCLKVMVLIFMVVRKESTVLSLASMTYFGSQKCFYKLQ